VLLKMSGHGADWRVTRRWDFGSYVHSSPPEGPPGGDPDPVWIYPALYPAGPDAWAVALVSDEQEGYSGGWGRFSVADFVVLADGSDAGAPTALYAGVDFACEMWVRSCFTEEDYRRAHGQCHDHYSGFLTLEYAPSSVPGRYTWTARWHSSDNPPGPRIPFPPAGGDVSQLFGERDECYVPASSSP
jgi:hypothetical protein